MDLRVPLQLEDWNIVVQPTVLSKVGHECLKILRLINCEDEFHLASERSDASLGLFKEINHKSYTSFLYVYSLPHLHYVSY